MRKKKIKLILINTFWFKFSIRKLSSNKKKYYREILFLLDIFYTSSQDFQYAWKAQDCDTGLSCLTMTRTKAKALKSFHIQSPSASGRSLSLILTSTSAPDT